MSAAISAEMGAEASAPELFTPPPEGAPGWSLVQSYRDAELTLPLHRALIAAEINDQCEIKSSHRKALLRSSQKEVARAYKRGFAKLNVRALEQAKWGLFILLVDSVIGNQHLSLREDEGARDALADDPRFGAPEARA